MARFDRQFERTAAPGLDLEFSESVYFVRRGVKSTAFDCAFSMVEEMVADEQPFATQLQARTWYPKLSALVISGNAVEPRRGDWFEIVATGERHEILPEGDGPAAARHPSGERFVVQTKRVKNGS